MCASVVRLLARAGRWVGRPWLLASVGGVLIGQSLLVLQGRWQEVLLVMPFESVRAARPDPNWAETAAPSPWQAPERGANEASMPGGWAEFIAALPGPTGADGAEAAAQAE